MGRLLIADLRRVFARRAVWWSLAVGALVVVVLGGVSMIFGLEGPGYQHYRETLGLFGLMAAGAGGFLGATAAGADWRHGSVGLLLTWDPRRYRWVVVRAISAAVAAMLVASILLVVGGAIYYFVFMHVLAPDPLSPSAYSPAHRPVQWDVIAKVYVAGVGITGWAAGVGAALGMVARNTAGAVVIAGAYMGIVETAARQYAGAQWVLRRHLMGLVNLTFPEVDRQGGRMTQLSAIPAPSTGTSVAVLGAVLVAVLAVAYMFTRFRDV